MMEKREFSMGIMPAILFILGIIAIQSIVITIWIRVAGDSISSQLYGSIFAQVFAYVFVIYFLFLKKGYRLHYAKNNWLNKPSIPLLAMALSFFISFALTPFLNSLPENTDVTAYFEELSKFPLLAIVAVIVIAPVFEEIIFRGIILNGLLKKYSPAVAIGVSSLLFGAFHLNLQQFVVASIIGVFCGLIYYWTNSIYYSIFFHASYNFIISFIVDFTYAMPVNFIVKSMIVVFSLLIIALQLAIIYYAKPKPEEL